MRALFVTGEGYDGPASECELLTHGGVAFRSEDASGPLVRLQIGSRDAGSLLRWIHATFPDADANVVGLRCDVCGSLATVNLHLLGGEGSGHWCAEHVPEDKRAEHEANLARGARPHEAVATLEGVSYYLRSAYGYKPDEILEALRVHPYTVQIAANQGMTVEAVAVDINRRRSRPSARLALEKAAGDRA